ncbi:MAG: rRNA maturation RNase YbeY [Clostridia bacterium]|nr:rRNA maturation RNase YbeY [Clostridia bacterium]
MVLEIEQMTEVPEGFLSLMQTSANEAEQAEGIRVKTAVHILLCDDETIRTYNRQWRATDRSTDVLSFPLVSYPAGKTAGDCEKRLMQAYDDETNCCMLGDLIISVPHALAQAEEYGHSPEREFAYLTVHGLCHLMGYDHIEEDDRIRMRSKEEQILNKMGLTRAD